MNQQPNYELLREAYAIIGGIPDNKVKLNLVVSEQGKSLECGTIACAAGWLGMHPTFQSLGMRVVRGDLEWWGSSTHSYTIPLARAFKMPTSEAHRLFCTRGNFDDNEFDYGERSDKQVWLDRVYAYLEKRGQLTSQLEAAKA